VYAKKVAGHCRESNPVPVNQEYQCQCLGFLRLYGR